MKKAALLCDNPQSVDYVYGRGRREALARLPLEQVRGDGYAFQIETTVHAWRLGMRVREVPIVFTDRLDGHSKLSNGIVWEAAWIVWWLRFARPWSRRRGGGAS